MTRILKQHTEHGEFVGRCGVDSGQIMLTDPCYVDGFIDGQDFDPEQEAPYEYSYNGACSATLKSHAGELGAGMGVVVSSGYGDGTYPVYVKKNNEGRIMSATIVFISEVETDEEEYE